MARKLIVEIIGDSSSLEKSFARSAKSARKFNTEMSGSVKVAHGLSRSLSGLFAGAAVAGGLKSVITAASDMNETLSKTDDVFGSNAAAVKAWSKTLVQSFGLSSRQALDTASSFGALFKPIGLVGDEAARQSEQLTQLGADLAAFYNTDVQDALDAVRSGIVGESEPLRRYGVLLSETRVQQQAMAETGKKNAKELTNQEKALARIHIILKDTKVAQGNFAQTQKNAAEQAKQLTANLDNLKVELGSGLLPVVNRTLHAFNLLAESIQSSSKQKPLQITGPGFLIRNKDLLGMLSIKQAIKLAAEIDKAMANLRRNRQAQGQGFSRAEDARTKGLTEIVGPAAPAPAAVKKAKRTAEQLNAFFDAMIDRKLFRGGFQPLKQQLVILKQVAALLQQRIAATKDITRKQNLEDQLLQVQADQKDVSAQLLQQQQDAAQKAKDAAQAALEKEQQLAEIQQQRRQAAEERAMGWLEFALEKAEATKGLGDDIKATEKIIAFLKKQIRLHGRTLDLVRQLWEMEQQLKELQGKRRKNKPKHGGGWVIGPLPSDLRTNPVAGGRPAGTGMAPTPATGFGSGLAVNQMTVNMYGVQNVSEMEHQLTKRAKARSQPRRGP